MNVRLWILLSLLVVLALSACTEKKDLSPPPLNPHPKETLHVSVSFERPEDAERYAIDMKALYQNQQFECGYIASWWVGNFIYPEGTFDIPNTSRDPKVAQFDIHLDRYDRDTCNWELAWPDFSVRDLRTGKELTGEWGGRRHLVPGTTYRAVCPFSESEYALSCFGEHPVPTTPLYNSIPVSRRVPITVHISKESASLRPKPSSHFDNFVDPAPSGNARSTPRMNSNDR